jgi:diguanylate cyclase (GGDEF)-like protein
MTKEKSCAVRGRAFLAHSALIQLGLVPVLFYIGVKLSLMFAVMPAVVVMLWVPNSILLAALLHYDMRRYAYLAGLVILAEIAADYPTFSPVEAALFGAINLVEVTIAYALLRHWRFNTRLTAPSDIGKFLIAGPIIAALAAACLAGLVYKYLRTSDTMYTQIVRTWWFSDATGLVILTPFILSVWPTQSYETVERVTLHWFDPAATLLGLAVLAVFLKADAGMFHGVHVRPSFLFPFAIYAAARLPPRATAIVVTIVAVAILWVTNRGRRPFGDLSVDDTVLQAQQVVFAISMTALGLSALLSQLRQNARELEKRVEERTQELRAANEQLARLSITDPLTGVFNRRALFELMHREMQRDQRHRRNLAVIIFDIDHFKQVNDQQGHAAGDLVLRHVAEVTAQTLRKTDIIARYGGEEFVIVAPETNATRALELAERIRDALRSSELPPGCGDIRVTASFGVGVMRSGDQHPEDVIGRADTALYAAKANGRDRVVLADTDA